MTPQATLTEQFRASKAPSEPPNGVLNNRPPSRQPVDLLAGSSTPSLHPGGSPSPFGRRAVASTPVELASSPVCGRLLEAVRQRARVLEQQLLVQRAFLMPCADRPAVLRQLQLRALRECALPDAAIGAVFSPAERQHGLAAAAAADEAATGGAYGPLPAPPCPAPSAPPSAPPSGRHYERCFGAPDVTLAHASSAHRHSIAARIRRDPTGSSDEYEDTACIL